MAGRRRKASRISRGTSPGAEESGVGHVRASVCACKCKCVWWLGVFCAQQDDSKSMSCRQCVCEKHVG